MPICERFLALIERDIAAGRNLYADLPAGVLESVRRAMEETEIDLNEDLGEEVAL